MKSLTRAEEQLMRIIWKLQSGFVKDFIAEMPDPKPPYNTISSVVRLLEKKGFVGYKAYGKTYEYFPLVSLDDYRKYAAGNLINNYFSGSMEKLVSFFAQENELDLSEIEQMLQLARKKDEDNQKEVDHE